MAITNKGKTGKGFSDEEKEAMRSRLADTEGEQAVLSKIEAMRGTDHAIATKLHDLIKASAPSLTPKTWYGMPAYAAGNKIVCFFQSAQRFKTRYLTLGFSDKALLDEGDIWPVTFAVQKLTPAVEAKIRALLKKAVSG